MTIKQNGGIFGRKPTFSTLDVDSSETGTALTVTSSGSGHNIDLVDSTATARIRNVSGRLHLIADVNDESASSSIRFSVDNNRKVDIDESGNIVFNGSGQGIDFSATSDASGSTSELFSDYEEGTWTPTLSSYEGTPTVSGFYTKIGNKVFLECSIDLDGTSDTSPMRIDGLPFSVNAEQLGGSYITRYSGGVTAFYLTFDGSSRIIPKTNANASMTYNDVGASALLELVTVYRTA
jgi:hypothetical protein